MIAHVRSNCIITNQKFVTKNLFFFPSANTIHIHNHRNRHTYEPNYAVNITIFIVRYMYNI